MARKLGAVQHQDHMQSLPVVPEEALPQPSWQPDDLIAEWGRSPTQQYTHDTQAIPFNRLSTLKCTPYPSLYGSSAALYASLSTNSCSRRMYGFARRCASTYEWRSTHRRLLDAQMSRHVANLFAPPGMLSVFASRCSAHFAVNNSVVVEIYTHHTTPKRRPFFATPVIQFKITK